MKVYDIIDNREIPAKKYTIAHDGDARDVARLFASGDLRLHLPADDGEGGAVCRWVFCHDTALTVKPARVIKSDSVADIVRRVYLDAKKKAKESEARFDKDRSEFNKYDFIQAVAVLAGVFDVAAALGMIDGSGEFGRL